MQIQNIGYPSEVDFFVPGPLSNEATIGVSIPFGVRLRIENMTFADCTSPYGVSFGGWFLANSDVGSGLSHTFTASDGNPFDLIIVSNDPGNIDPSASFQFDLLVETGVATDEFVPLDDTNGFVSFVGGDVAEIVGGGPGPVECFWTDTIRAYQDCEDEPTGGSLTIENGYIYGSAQFADFADFVYEDQFFITADDTGYLHEFTYDSGNARYEWNQMTGWPDVPDIGVAYLGIMEQGGSSWPVEFMFTEA